MNACDYVPSTDEEVIAKLSEGSPGVFRNARLGLYRMRRTVGDDVLVAYEATLRALGKPDRDIQ